MRLPRVRFTVRQLMVLVAVMAVASWGCFWFPAMSRIRKDRLKRAQNYDYLAQVEMFSLSKPLAKVGRDISDIGVLKSADQDVKRLDKSQHTRDLQLAQKHWHRAMYYLQLRRKLEQEASRPWVPAEPTPPPLPPGIVPNIPFQPYVKF